MPCSAIRRYYKKALQDCNLPDIRIHDLRHSYATLLLKKNIAPKVASKMLGHSDTRTTLDIYTHVLTNMQEPVTNALNDTFKDITVTNAKSRPCDLLFVLAESKGFFGAHLCAFASLRSLTPSAKTVHRTVFFRRLRLLPPCSNPSFCFAKAKSRPCDLLFVLAESKGFEPSNRL